MIDLTRLNGVNFTVNCDLIESIEETPDTVGEGNIRAISKS